MWQLPEGWLGFWHDSDNKKYMGFDVLVIFFKAQQLLYVP